MVKIGWWVWIPVLFSLSCSDSDFRVATLSCGYNPTPRGIDPGAVSFSWTLESGGREVVQTAYRILVSEALTNDLVWDSGKTQSETSIGVPYGGSALLKGTSYTWKMMAWDNHHNQSPWSTPARFTTGLTNPDDWEGAAWIAYDELDPVNRIVPGIHVPGYRPEWRDKPSGNHLLPVFRREFTIQPGLKEALVFVTGLGHYELRINGLKVGDHFLSPGWTHYDSFCLYNVFDVTSLLQKGANAAGMMLGNGFYIIPNNRYRKLITAYGNPKMILKLQLVYRDGHREVLVSDGLWKMNESPVTYSSLYGGETYDATREQEGWDKPGFDDAAWKPAKVVKAPTHRLEAESDYPVQVNERLEAVRITPVDSVGSLFVYDFGQNASGIPEIRVKGHRGDTVKLVPGELVDAGGRVMQGATGKPFILTFILKGEGIETWSPRFTYYGFRYLEVEGARPEKFNANDNLPVIYGLTMLHTGNSAPAVGSFHTSEELFNRIDQLIRWAIRSNLQSVMTDCPHREKLGWLEQTHLMGTAVHFNFDVYHLSRKLVRDMMTAQFPDGMVPNIAPEYTRFEGPFLQSPEWGSACIILPWLIRSWYGDTQPMEEAWNMMTRYAAYLESKSENHLLDFGLGDWYDQGPNPPGFAQLTPVRLPASAIYYYDLTLLAKMAGLLGKPAEAAEYAGKADQVREAFNREFFDPANHTYSTGSQTALAMPLVLGLVPEDQQDAVFQSLVRSIEDSGKALTAGDVGFHYLVRALADGGAGTLLYEMNAREDVPGYGYQLKKGATALTESWAALDRVSNNHLMLGHIMEWFYSGLAGIAQSDASVAYRTLIIAPQMAGPIREASASFRTPYGITRSGWRRSGNRYELDISVPVNASARVILPGAGTGRVTEGGNPLPDAWIAGLEDSSMVVNVGSGNYHFLWYGHGETP